MITSGLLQQIYFMSGSDVPRRHCCTGRRGLQRLPYVQILKDRPFVQRHRNSGIKNSYARDSYDSRLPTYVPYITSNKYANDPMPVWSTHLGMYHCCAGRNVLNDIIPVTITAAAPALATAAANRLQENKSVTGQHPQSLGSAYLFCFLAYPSRKRGVYAIAYR